MTSSASGGLRSVAYRQGSCSQAGTKDRESAVMNLIKFCLPRSNPGQVGAIPI